jgi:2-oxoglutarate dehydrogenase complex dehydrogenase (E1) component-like enzyme
VALNCGCANPAGVPNDVLQEVGKAVTDIPKDFTPHRLIKKLFQQRRDMITGDARKPLVDWGMAETLAFGTLLSEGGLGSSSMSAAKCRPQWFVCC